MSISIKVRFSYPPIEKELTGRKLIAEVVHAVGMPAEIFVYHCGVPANDEQSMEFSHVATPNDLEEYPVNAPDLENEIPFFRLSKVELFFRDSCTLFETKKLIEKDINSLVYALRVNATVMEQEEVIFDGSKTTADIPWDSSEMLV